MLFQDAFLRGHGFLAGREYLQLAGQRFRILPVSAVFRQRDRKNDTARAVPLRDQACFKGPCRDRTPFQPFQGNACLRVVEADQDLTRRHDIAVTHTDFADDPAFQMFDRLAVRFDRNHARRDRRALQWRQGRPTAERQEKQSDDRPPLAITGVIPMLVLSVMFAPPRPKLA